MPTRCLNKVMLIGNLTRDPELRYTPGGMAVASFGLATNRAWTTKQGEKKEDAQFHRIVAWNKLAELCSQLLTKGMRVYVEGRLQYREWVGQDGQKKQVAEIIISDMVILSPGKTGDHDEVEIETGTGGGEGMDDIIIPDEEIDMATIDDKQPEGQTAVKEDEAAKEVDGNTEDKGDQDMPF